MIKLVHESTHTSSSSFKYIQSQFIYFNLFQEFIIKSEKFGKTHVNTTKNHHIDRLIY